jgi:DNA helicase-4
MQGNIKFIFISIIALIVGFIMYRLVQLILLYNLRNKLEYEFEKKLQRELVSEIEEALSELALTHIYVSFLTINNWIKKNNSLYEKLSKHEVAINRFAPYHKEYRQIIDFKQIMQNSEEQRKQSNSNFVKSMKYELSNSFFSTLDDYQLEAVVIDEDNNLIIAGAGTGKTTTIAAKVAYLKQMKQIDIENVLLLSFTNNSCNDLSNRINDKYQIDIPVLTFHKLGNHIIRSVNETPANVLELDNFQLLDVFQSFLKNFIQDETYFNRLINYFISYLKPYQPYETFDSESDVNSYIKNHNITSYKRITKINAFGIEYSYREVLKSMEELEIANFLFMHNVEYIYENPYEIDTKDEFHRQYKPDFYLPKYKIYIEHFAIDEEGNVPQWFRGTSVKTATQLYNEGIEWKRSIHQQHRTTLIQTYSWQKRQNCLLTTLKIELEKRGVQLRLKPLEEFLDSTKDLYDDVSNFVKLIQTFMSLLKSQNVSIDSLRIKNNEIEKFWVKERNDAFLSLLEPFYENYQLLLSEENKIDFNDMINDATNYVNQGEYQKKFQYIIIDEYQDISLSCFRLIKALIDSNPECKLVCVGDDWQSIYRFTGSEICFLTEFEKYFNNTSQVERKTQKVILNKTFRFNTALINLSSDFVLKNPGQIPKELQSFTDDTSVSYSFEYYNPETKKLPDIICNILTTLDLQNQGDKFEVLLLGRYKADINPFKLNALEFEFNENGGGISIVWKKNRNVSIRFLTVHTAKGLESDYVILLNGNSGKYGFPSQVSDDPVMNLLLSESDQYPYGEERRLFYVALTRSRKHIYILSNEESVSAFVQEIDENYVSRPNICPKCYSGVLKQRTSKDGNYFYGCSDFPLCDFTRELTIREKAYLFFEQGKFDEALNYFNEEIERLKTIMELINPLEGLYDSYISRGICNYKIKIYAQSIMDFEEGLQTQAENQGSRYYNVSRLYEYSKRTRIDSIFDSSNIREKDVEIFSYYIHCLDNSDMKIEAEIMLNRLKNVGVKISHVNIVDTHPENQINESLMDMLNAVSRAIEEESLIKFRYEKTDANNNLNVSLRLVRPYGIFEFGVTRSICFSGFCYLRNEERTFSIVKISNLIVNPGILECWEN